MRYEVLFIFARSQKFIFHRSFLRKMLEDALHQNERVNQKSRRPEIQQIRVPKQEIDKENPQESSEGKSQMTVV